MCLHHLCPLCERDAVEPRDVNSVSPTDTRLGRRLEEERTVPLAMCFRGGTPQGSQSQLISVQSVGTPQH